MSIPVRAISAHVTATAQAAAMPKPKCQAAQADKMPVASSTAGYRAEMRVLQAAHRPRSASQLIRGMFCQAVIGALHTGQAERGTTKLKCPGGAAGLCGAESSSAAPALLVGNRRAP